MDIVTMIDLHHGDCLDIMPTLEADSVDTVICDPPYGLSFMGKDWDHGIPGPRFWREALRVAKPGAMLLAFGGTRTFHRLACAIEDAGWELRDTVMWVYGSGFPKSHDISKAIDKAAGAEREQLPGKRHERYSTVNGTTFGGNEPRAAHWNTITAPATPAAETWHGWGTALKPAWEPIIVAMKPLDGTFAQNALQHGVAGLWIDGARVGTEVLPEATAGQSRLGTFERGVMITPERSGRWPANLIHDGSDEVLAGFPNDAGRYFYTAKASRSERNAGLEGMEARDKDDHNLSSNACARCGLRVKANGSGVKCECGDLRETVKLAPAVNHHPTVKPIALMRYLARLTKTPSGGVVLDPFMGSGSTGIGAVLEGRDFIGIEQDADYIEIARRRIEHWQAEAEREAAQLELQFD